jgi:rhodanese-related sulfurtransferase
MAASISPHEAWDETRVSGHPILDLRSRLERQRFGSPPGSMKVSFLRHSILPKRNAIYLCQHAVRSKLPASRGGREIDGGFVAWQAAGLPVEGSRSTR